MAGSVLINKSQGKKGCKNTMNIVKNTTGKKNNLVPKVILFFVSFIVSFTLGFNYLDGVIMADEEKKPTQLDKLRLILIEEEEDVNLSLTGGDIYIEEVEGGAVPPGLLEWWTRTRGQVLGDEFSQVGGGDLNLADSSYSVIPGGIGAHARYPGHFAVGNRLYNKSGQSQWSVILVSGITTDDTPLNLTVNGVAGGVELEVPENMAWVYTFDCIYSGVGFEQAGHWAGEGMVLRRTTTSLLGSFTNLFKRGVGTPQRNVVLSYENALGVMRFQATGGAGMTYHWVCRVDITECGSWVP